MVCSVERRSRRADAFRRPNRLGFGYYVTPACQKQLAAYMTVCPFPNPKTPPNIVPMRPSCRWNQSRPDAAGHGAPLPLASLHPHCNLLAARSGTKWYRMVQKLNFSPARQPASQSGAWPSRPIAHGLSASALQPAGPPEWDEMGQNGRGTHFPRRANQQAGPGHGHLALLPMASPYPHCNLPALRNGTKWDKMVGELNFSPARQPASQSGAWPSRPIAHGLSVPALQSAGPTEWDEMGQNGRGTQFFPGGQTAGPEGAWPRNTRSGRS